MAALGTQRTSALSARPCPVYGRSSDAPRGLLDPAVVTALDPKPTWAMQTKGSLASKLVSQKCAELIDRGLGSSFVIFYPVAEVPFPRLEPIIVERVIGPRVHNEVQVGAITRYSRYAYAAVTGSHVATIVGRGPVI